MAQLTSIELVDKIRGSGLIKEERLTDFLDELAAASGGGLPEDNKAIIARFVEAELLTEWQGRKILEGKNKGFILGKYKLLGEIGKGGMSSVYLAEHIMMQRRVAIKVLPRKRVNDKSYLERFRLEARAVARLDDPNIVRAYDIDSQKDTHYIVMEYVEGKDLHNVIADNGPVDYLTAADYIAQACNGLQHAHEMGLVHRDIKPANLLLDKNQTVKLLDLGLARVINDEESSLTLANEENVLGTADYLAPEQAINSHSADARADVYSMGCTLYYLLTGRPPFPEGTISERLLKHQVETPEPIIKFRPDAPLSLVDIVQRMMQKKADDRFQTSGAVAQALTEWLEERGRKPGGGSVDSGSDGSGVGSGVFGRYGLGSGLGSAPPSGAGVSSGPRSGSGGLSSPMRDTEKLSGSDTGPMTDEDLELAPLDEEHEQPKTKRKATAAPQSSGVLSDAPSSPGQSKATSSASGKRKTIFEEEFQEHDEHQEAVRKAIERSEYNPLHPPGYKNPYSGNTWIIWVIVGLVLLAAAGVGLINLLG